MHSVSMYMNKNQQMLFKYSTDEHPSESESHTACYVLVLCVVGAAEEALEVSSSAARRPEQTSQPEVVLAGFNGRNLRSGSRVQGYQWVFEITLESTRAFPLGASISYTIIYILGGLHETCFVFLVFSHAPAALSDDVDVFWMEKLSGRVGATAPWRWDLPLALLCLGKSGRCAASSFGGIGAKPRELKTEKMNGQYGPVVNSHVNAKCFLYLGISSWKSFSSHLKSQIGVIVFSQQSNAVSIN